MRDLWLSRKKEAYLLHKINSVRSKTTGSKRKIGQKSRCAPVTDGDMDMGDEDEDTESGMGMRNSSSSLLLYAKREIF